MGWLWSSSTSSATTQKSPSPSSSIPISQSPSNQSIPSPIPDQQAPTKSSASAPSEPDLDQWLSSLSEPTGETYSSPAIIPKRTPRNPTDSPFYPSHLSCTQSFDLAFHCQMFAGQFTSYYRTGSFRDCSELWSNFWFCLRTNRGFMSDEARKERVQGFYRAREERLRKKGCSEDFWEARNEDEVLEYGGRQWRWDFREFERSGKRVLRREREEVVEEKKSPWVW